MPHNVNPVTSVSQGAERKLCQIVKVIRGRDSTISCDTFALSFRDPPRWNVWPRSHAKGNDSGCVGWSAHCVASIQPVRAIKPNRRTSGRADTQFRQSVFTRFNISRSAQGTPDRKMPSPARSLHPAPRRFLPRLVESSQAGLRRGRPTAHHGRPPRRETVAESVG